ncbi:adenylate kinase [Boudabousia tangfeifanii]|uniref:Adenylate kinase n=1 Tax=Boudabousia tangfeifanii TaxID=1912795 RepID=A0A1D9MIY8_9ACTO|nr:adenylate kinase [Boudabousia tangfeifanii]AOZ72246.1 adenylate kinase [Boudabousia tangfeifanii]
MTRLLLVGPPGAGKGTQAKHIAESLNIPHISTGEIFRLNISSQTELGKQAQAYIEKGEFVPDTVTNPMVKDRLAQEDAANGFLLDGYPRTLEQAKLLAGMLAELGTKLDLVIEIMADTDEVVNRLLKRAEIENRADDTEEVIRHRMEVYEELTVPLTDFYREQGILVQVDGHGTIDEVAARIDEVLAK